MCWLREGTLTNDFKVLSRLTRESMMLFTEILRSGRKIK